MIHADGVVGGPTPKGLLFLSFFNERNPIPQQVVYSIEKSAEREGWAKLGREITEERVSRQSVVRETELGVLLDLETAEKLHEWLTGQIEALRKQRNRSDRSTKR